MHPPPANIVVIGTGHLAQRVREHLRGAAKTVLAVDDLEVADLSSISRAYLVDDGDETNLRSLVTIKARAPHRSRHARHPPSGRGHPDSHPRHATKVA